METLPSPPESPPPPGGAPPPKNTRLFCDCFLDPPPRKGLFWPFLGVFGGGGGMALFEGGGSILTLFGHFDQKTHFRVLNFAFFVTFLEKSSFFGYCSQLLSESLLFSLDSSNSSFWTVHNGSFGSHGSLARCALFFSIFILYYYQFKIQNKRQKKNKR